MRQAANGGAGRRSHDEASPKHTPQWEGPTEMKCSFSTKERCVVILAAAGARCLWMCAFVWSHVCGFPVKDEGCAL